MNPISSATLERTMSFIIESHSILNQTAEDASVTYIKKGDRTLLIISGRPFFLTFMQITHQVLTEPLCHAQGNFYSLPNNEQVTK